MNDDLSLYTRIGIIIVNDLNWLQSNIWTHVIVTDYTLEMIVIADYRNGHTG